VVLKPQRNYVGIANRLRFVQLELNSDSELCRGCRTAATRNRKGQQSAKERPASNFNCFKALAKNDVPPPEVDECLE